MILIAVYTSELGKYISESRIIRKIRKKYEKEEEKEEKTAELRRAEEKGRAINLKKRMLLTALSILIF